MKALTVDVKYSPKELAEICREHGHGSSQFSFACCPFPGASCPIGSQKTCSETTTEDWEKVLQDEEPEPRFRFGDKVTADGRRAVFVNYHAPASAAAILYEGNHVTDSVFVSDIKEGWA